LRTDLIWTSLLAIVTYGNTVLKGRSRLVARRAAPHPAEWDRPRSVMQVSRVARETVCAFAQH